VVVLPVAAEVYPVAEPLGDCGSGRGCSSAGGGGDGGPNTVCNSQYHHHNHHLDFSLASAPFASNAVEAFPLNYMRPEFLYVQVIRSNPHIKVGISLKRFGGGGDHDDDQTKKVRISKVDAKGLFARTPLRPGDVVVAVNGISCHDRSTEEVFRLVKASMGTLSILVRNETGHPNLLSSTAQKPTGDARVGVTVKDDRGAIVVARVAQDGLLAGSLLMPGHRCIEVNGQCCEPLGPSEAVKILAGSPDFVTIVSRPTVKQTNHATVLSCSNDEAFHKNSSWWKKCVITAGDGLGTDGLPLVSLVHL